MAEITILDQWQSDLGKIQARSLDAWRSRAIDSAVEALGSATDPILATAPAATAWAWEGELSLLYYKLCRMVLMTRLEQNQKGVLSPLRLFPPSSPATPCSLPCATSSPPFVKWDLTESNRTHRSYRHFSLITERRQPQLLADRLTFSKSTKAMCDKWSPPRRYGTSLSSGGSGYLERVEINGRVSSKTCENWCVFQLVSLPGLL